MAMLRSFIEFARGVMHKFSLSILIASLALACISRVAAAPFQNGSFEIGTDPGASFLTLANGDNTNITGWTVIQGDIDYIGGYWQPAQGSRSLDLIGDQFVGGVQQTFDTVPGATYSVSFEMAGNPAGGPTIRPLAVTVAGNTQNFTFDITGATLSNMNWTAHQFNFVATGASATIQFVSDLTGDPAGCCYGAALDNVQIVGLPSVGITKTHGGSFSQGQTGATYTLTVSNVGAGPTAGTVTVTDTLPPSLAATSFSGTGWTCAPLPTLSCTRSDALAAGSSYPMLTLTVDVSASAPPSVVNSATASGGGSPSSATANDTTAIGQIAALAISKTHSGAFSQGQTGATYTLTVSNTGAGPTAGTVTVTDTLPPSLAATSFSGAGWACAPLPTLSCTRGDALAPAASYPAITLIVSVSPSAPPSVVNSATASGGGSLSSATANDSALVSGGVATPIPAIRPLALLLLALLVAAGAWRARQR